jgi:hypothetical protein
MPQQQFGQGKFEIRTGEAERLDDSPNAILVSPTDKDNVVALSTTYAPDEKPQIWTTNQVMSLITAAEEGRLRRLGINPRGGSR